MRPGKEEPRWEAKLFMAKKLMTFHVTDLEHDCRIDFADVTGWWIWIRNTKENQGKARNS